MKQENLALTVKHGGEGQGDGLELNCEANVGNVVFDDA